MCKIIPFLKEGYLYNEAVILAKIPELLGEKWEVEKVEQVIDILGLWGDAVDNIPGIPGIAKNAFT